MQAVSWQLGKPLLVLLPTSISSLSEAAHQVEQARLKAEAGISHSN